MRFSALISSTPAATPVRGDTEITKIAYDSRRVEPGTLFVAMGGVGHDALAYLGDALERGAAAVLAPAPPPAGVEVPWAVSEDPRLALAQLAAHWFGHPAEKLRLVGVTGTNGKTTCAHITAGILAAAGRRTALFGTTGYWLGDRWEEADWTTPEPLKLHGLFREAVDVGLSDVVMEVTSHALDQRRTDGLVFAAAGFTNVTREHLDYHRRLEGYYATKCRLFTQLEPGAVALLNSDDPLVAGTPVPDGRRVLYGLGETAELRAEGIRYGRRSLAFTAVHGPWSLPVETPLVGEYDVYNALLAIGVARGFGVEDAAIVRGLKDLGQIPGRFHFLDVGADFDVVVDYAHTPDGIAKALTAARRIAAGRVIIVFGSAGERDAAKRPDMGRAAGELADVVILTTEDPRREDPAKIAEEIASGVAPGSCELYTVLDRREAVHQALGLAKKGDLVIVAGKGDEYRLKFADRVELSNDIDLCLEYFGLTRAQAGVTSPHPDDA
jgi:UDP-N-acetylmuramoyl-L-alanyl-D-glutamate--2,6-diaminopimelate ligase